LKLSCDVLLSTSAFEFNLRRHTEVAGKIGAYVDDLAAGLVGSLPPPFER
jgi:hypothetical protein